MKNFLVKPSDSTPGFTAAKCQDNLYTTPRIQILFLSPLIRIMVVDIAFQLSLSVLHYLHTLLLQMLEHTFNPVDLPHDQLFVKDRVEIFTGTTMVQKLVSVRNLLNHLLMRFYLLQPLYRPNLHFWEDQPPEETGIIEF